MMIDEASDRPLDWLLNSLVERVPQALNALLLSADGLATASTRDLNQDDADQLAAICAGLFSLAKGAGQKFADSEEVRQVVVEIKGAMLFVAAAGFGTCITVLTSGEADPGQIGYEMGKLVKSMRPHLETAPRVDRAAEASGAWSRATS